MGSFPNVVLWRVPRGESIVTPGSHCPSCETFLRPVELIPVLSWVAPRGRCRTCGVHISARYPLRRDRLRARSSRWSRGSSSEYRWAVADGGGSWTTAPTTPGRPSRPSRPMHRRRLRRIPKTPHGPISSSRRCSSARRSRGCGRTRRCSVPSPSPCRSRLAVEDAPKTAPSPRPIRAPADGCRPRGGRRRRSESQTALLIGGAVLTLVIAGGAAFALTSGGGDDAKVATGTAVTTTVAPTTTAAAPRRSHRRRERRKRLRRAPRSR